MRRVRTRSRGERARPVRKWDARGMRRDGGEDGGVKSERRSSWSIGWRNTEREFVRKDVRRPGDD